MGFLQGEGRRQGTLFPVTLEELIPEDHVSRVIDAFVGRLDMAGLGFDRAEAAETGRPGYDPRDLLKLYRTGATPDCQPLRAPPPPSAAGCDCRRLRSSPAVPRSMRVRHRLRFARVEGNLDELVSTARGAHCVILAGPTASPWPPPFFAAGIDVLGGFRVRDGARACWKS